MAIKQYSISCKCGSKKANFINNNVICKECGFFHGRNVKEILLNEEKKIAVNKALREEVFNRELTEDEKFHMKLGKKLERLRTSFQKPKLKKQKTLKQVIKERKDEPERILPVKNFTAKFKPDKRELTVSDIVNSLKSTNRDIYNEKFKFQKNISQLAEKLSKKERELEILKTKEQNLMRILKKYS